MVAGVDQDEGQGREVEQRVVDPEVSLRFEVRAKVAHRVDAAQQGHRQRPHQKERAQRVESNPQRADRVGPGEITDHWRPSEQNRDGRSPHQPGCDALRSHADAGTRRVAQRQKTRSRSQRQDEHGGDEGRHSRPASMKTCKPPAPAPRYRTFVLICDVGEAADVRARAS